MNNPSLFDLAAEQQAIATGKPLSQARAIVAGETFCRACGYAHSGKCEPGSLFEREDDRERRDRGRRG